MNVGQNCELNTVISCSCHMVQAYAGKVRTDIDHNVYKPAAWRVDSYLDESDEEEDLVGSLRSHRLVFSKDGGAVDAMARQEKLDDYKVLAPCILRLLLSIRFVDDRLPIGTKHLCMIAAKSDHTLDPTPYSVEILLGLAWATPLHMQRLNTHVTWKSMLHQHSQLTIQTLNAAPAADILALSPEAVC